jgi:hypothetical protein
VARESPHHTGPNHAETPLEDQNLSDGELLDTMIETSGWDRDRF